MINQPLRVKLGVEIYVIMVEGGVEETRQGNGDGVWWWVVLAFNEITCARNF
jgi:hypothetical protein